MLILCGGKGGLICSLTRLVHFGPISDDLKRKEAACAQVDATFIASTRPGKNPGDIFESAVATYTATGYPDEWQKHHQGGSAGEELHEIQSVTGGRGVDVSIAAVIPGGRVILVGIPADDQTSFTASVARRKGLTLKLVRRMNNTYPRAIELVSKRLVDVRSLITHRFPLQKAAEAFAVAQQRMGLKVTIEL